MRYLLDTNVFIEAKNRYYGLDFCPAFWEWLILRNTQGSVHSIEKVGDELAAGADDLALWAVARGESFFAPPDHGVLQTLAEVGDWVNNQQYHPSAVGTFLQDADYYLVAHAMAHHCIVVTHEVASNGARRVKIPNVCIGVKVKCISPFEMLRRERARCVLEG